VTFSVTVAAPPLLYNSLQGGSRKKTWTAGAFEEAIMNGKYGAGQVRRRAGVLAAAAAVAMLTAACGAHVSVATDPSGSAAYRANLAYAQCMRTHGAPNFPIPSPGESFHISGHPKGTVHGPRTQANQACEHLLPPGSVTRNVTRN
jgi:hypothetical protein